MILYPLIEYPENAVADGDGIRWIIRFLLPETFREGILMFLFVFFEIAHIEVLFIAALNLTNVFSPLLLILQVHLHVLLQIRCSRKRFTALFANERFVLRMDASVSVQIRFLIKFLVALIEITFVWPCASVHQLVPLQS